MTPETKQSIQEDFKEGKWTSYEISLFYDVSYSDVLKVVGQHLKDVRIERRLEREALRKKAMQNIFPSKGFKLCFLQSLSMLIGSFS